MYPDSDSRAEQFDDALERRRTGDEQADDDPEIQELVHLASRLERTLPEDTPDPAFHASLKQQLLSGTASPPEPVDLNEERWHRRLTASPWRLSAAAAAVTVFAVVAVVMGMNPFESDDGNGGSSDAASFQTLDQGDSVQPENTFSGSTGASAENPAWLASSFPPFDHEHVVLPMFLRDLLSGDDEPADVELNDAGDMVENADMPETAPVYYLSAPTDAGTMLTTLRSTLGIEGEIVNGSNGDEPSHLVNQDDEPVISWDPTAAHFHFQGDALEEPITAVADGDGDPLEIAVGFLEQIGFDLSTIQYEQRVTEDGAVTEVEFRPADLPDMSLEMTLGGHVMIGAGGAIREAEMVWLSLIDSRNATLRDPEEIMHDVENGGGYSPPMPDTDEEDRMEMDVDDARLMHVLTRLEEGSFILQPAMALSGEYDGMETPEMPELVSHLIPAADSAD